MTGYSPIERQKIFPYDTRFRPIAPPETGIFDEPRVSICINVKWMAHIDGVIDRLMWLDAWAGDQETKEYAVGEITKLVGAIALREACGDDMACCEDLQAQLSALEAMILQSTVIQQEATAKAIRDEFLRLYTEGDLLHSAVNDAGPTTNWDGESGEYSDALCRGLTAFMYMAAAQKVNQLRVGNTALISAIGLASLSIPGLSLFLLAAAGIGGAFGYDLPGVLIQEIVDALTDTDALDNVICHMTEELEGAPLFGTAFSVVNTTHPFTEGTNEAIICAVFNQQFLQENELVAYDFVAEAFQMESVGFSPLVECPCSDEPPPEGCEDLTDSTGSWYPSNSSGEETSEFGVWMDGEGAAPNQSNSQFFWARNTSEGVINSITLTYNEAVTGVYLYALTAGGSCYYTGSAVSEITFDVSTDPDFFPIDISEHQLALTFTDNLASSIGVRLTEVCFEFEEAPVWETLEPEFGPTGTITSQTSTSIEIESGNDGDGTDRTCFQRVDNEPFTVDTVDVTGTVGFYLWYDADNFPHDTPLANGDVAKTVNYEGYDGTFTVTLTIEP